MSKLDTFLAILHTALPIALTLIPGVPPVAAGLIMHAISTAETLGGDGVDKKSVAMAIVADGISSTNAIANKTIIDPSVGQAVSAVIDSTIKTINAIKNPSPIVTPPVV